jgi:hypothetical protein
MPHAPVISVEPSPITVPPINAAIAATVVFIVIRYPPAGAYFFL